MNTSTKILAITIVCFFSKNTKAQDSSHRAKSIYIEVLPLKELGTIFTANFDVRFGKKQNGLGAHAGLGFAKSLIAGNTFYIPIGVNTLIGKSSHYFEPGLEVINILYSKYHNNKTVIGLLPTVGYRYQPSYNGLTFRAFAGAFIKNRTFFTAGLSIGYKF